MQIVLSILCSRDKGCDILQILVTSAISGNHVVQVIESILTLK